MVEGGGADVGGVAANSSRTAYAAATASSTWASVGTLTLPTRRPSQGELTSKVSSPVAWRPASQKAWVTATVSLGIACAGPSALGVVLNS